MPVIFDVQTVHITNIYRLFPVRLFMIKYKQGEKH